MPSPMLRSRSVKKLFRRTNSGTRIIYKAGKPSKAICAICAAKLNAVPNRIPSEMRKLAKTEKRPERVFGGVLCGGCTSTVLKEKSRLSNASIMREHVPLNHLKYVDMLR